MKWGLEKQHFTGACYKSKWKTAALLELFPAQSNQVPESMSPTGAGNTHSQGGGAC